MKKGDKKINDVSCDSSFMISHIRKIGTAVRSAYKDLGYYVTIYLWIDNVGGHGKKEIIDEKKQF